MRKELQTARDRRRLLRDFERRLFFEERDPPSRVLRRPRSVAIIIHPMSDEIELQKELGITPDKCVHVDAYWRFEESVYWTEFRGSRAFRDIWVDSPGVFYRYNQEQHQDTFNTILAAPSVSSTDLHVGFENLEALIDSGIIETLRSSACDQWIRLK